jgi:cytochrome P450 family 2 subfamily J
LFLFAFLGPFGLPHSTLNGQVQIGPYTVPKGHTIRADFTSIMQGKDWKNGNSFDPSRFLDENGNLQQNEKLIPFSIGKRVCPGEGLARTEIFLFFVALLQKFKFEPEDVRNPPAFEFKSGTTAVPLPFEVRLTNC